MFNSSSMPTRVAIVEDNNEIRETLAFFISNSPGFECVAACASGEEALALLPELKPNVILMDIGLPGINGIECIKQLRSSSPESQIMMLTVFEDDERIYQSLEAGANGYLIKKTEPAKLLEAIGELHRGGAPMSPSIAIRVVRAFRTPLPDESAKAALSPREWEIVEHLSKGFLYKEIADALGISLDTVRTHIHRIYQKLHARSRTEAVNKAFKRPLKPQGRLR
jgi:DNA-binding NarL/FixJ family response regulator